MTGPTVSGLGAHTLMKTSLHASRWGVALALLAGFMALVTAPVAWPAPPVSSLQAETVVTPDEIHAIIKEPFTRAGAARRGNL